METRTDGFRDLTVEELYDVYRLRSEVFVAGEGIVYPDPDGDDLRALHVRIIDGGEVAAYARVFPSGPGEATIGRVLAVRRGEGLGTAVMRAAIEAARGLGASRVVVASQLRVTGFYRSLGFREVSGVFDEYGVDHVMMALDLRCPAVGLRSSSSINGVPAGTWARYSPCSLSARLPSCTGRCTRHRRAGPRPRSTRP